MRIRIPKSYAPGGHLQDSSLYTSSVSAILWKRQFPILVLLGSLSPSGVTSPTGAEKGSDAGVGEFFNRLT